MVAAPPAAVENRPGTGGEVLPGWMLCVTLHGAPPVPGNTVTAATVTTEPDGVATADLTLFTDEDGRPLFGGLPVLVDGEVKQGTFRYQVADLQTCRHTGIIVIHGGQCQLEGHDPVAEDRARVARCAAALTVVLQRPGFGAGQPEVAAVVPVARLARVLASSCIDTCDADCENGPVHCTWVHEPSHKPGWHSPEACPAATLTVPPSPPPGTAPGPVP